MNILVVLFILSILTKYKGVNSLYPLTIMLIFLYILINVIVKGINLNKKELLRLKSKQIFIVFIIFSLISTIINIKNSNDIILLREIIITYLIFFICIFLNQKKSCKFYVDFYLSVVNIGLILGIMGVVEGITKVNDIAFFLHNENFANSLINTFTKESYRTFSVFQHPIIWGNMLVILFIINISLNKNKNKLYKIITNAIIIINLYFTQSRSAWISFVCIIIFLFIKIIISRKWKKGINYKSIGIFYSITLLIILFFNQISIIITKIFSRFNQLTEGRGQVSAGQRLGTIDYVMNSLGDKSIFYLFIGNGYKSLEIHLKDVTIILSNFSTSDNQYLNILYEFGIVGFVLYVLFFIYTVMLFFKTKKDLDICSTLIILGVSVNMFFYSAWGWSVIMMIFLVAIASIGLVDDELSEGEA